MTALTIHTESTIGRLLGDLEREECREVNQDRDNPLITVITQALYLLREASKNNLDFHNYDEVLATIQTRLDEKNDEDYEMHEETNQSVLSWLQEF